MPPLGALRWRVTRLWLLLALMLALGLGSWQAFQSSKTTPTPAELLTGEERAWLALHPVLRLAPDPNFPPLEYFDEDGHYRGLIADYFPLLEARLGVRFQTVRAATWEEVLSMAKRREVDVLGAAQLTPARAQYLNFSQSVIDIPNAIIASNHTQGSLDFSGLAGRKLAITRGNALDEYVRSQFPDIQVVAVADDLTGLQQVSFGHADATIVNLAIASHLIAKHGIANLHVAGDSGRSNALHIASRNDWPILNQILSKGLAAITDGERQTIYRRWIRLENRFGTSQDLAALFGTGAAFTLVLIVILLFNRSLRRLVNARTAALKQQLSERSRAETLQLALHKISETSHTASDLPSLLERIHRIIAGLMPAENLYVALYDETTQEISFPYFADSHDSVPKPSKMGAGGLTETVLKTGEALLITPESIESVAQTVKASLGSDFIDWLGVPLKTEGRSIGVLAVQSYTGEVRYTENDKTLLQFVSDQLAMTIERKEAEAHLQLAAKVFKYAQEGITITDAAANIVDVNATFTRITGYAREEAIGANSRILQSGRHDAEFYAAMWASLKATGHWSGEIWNRRKNGEVYAEMLHISSVVDADGVPQNYVSLFSDITSLKEHQSQLEHIAHYDALTGLPNRIMLADRLRQATAQTRRRENLMALVYLDLDGFKVINDSFGHEVGDELLIALAQRLKEALREGDTLARMGGDEFVAVLTDLSSADECEVVLDRLLQAAASKMQIKDLNLCVSASLGVTLFPLDSGDPDTLLRHADQAMYQAKQAGKNRYHLFDQALDEMARTHQESYQRIAQGLECNEFVLFYQPKVNMRLGKVIGAEALIRWQHPQLGMLPPGDFLPLIENSELISRVGDWVLDAALRQMEAWRGEGFDIAVSVNIAAHHLQQPDFLPNLREKLSRHPDVRAENLELELLETAALEDIHHVSQVIRDCQVMGIKISLDDFGTGYSSLTYLKRLPATVLKIDQSFVHDMLWDTEDLSIVEGVIGLAGAFHRTVIAEGVETPEHGRMLLKLGCDLGQGYGIARPMPAEKMAEWTRTWRPDGSWSNCPELVLNRNELPLVYAEVDHRYWVKWMENWLEGATDKPPPFDTHECRFGIWYHGEGRGHYGHLSEFQTIGAIHEQVHELGRNMLHQQREDRLAEAKAGLDDLNALRDKLITNLLQLSEVLGETRK